MMKLSEPENSLIAPSLNVKQVTRKVTSHFGGLDLPYIASHAFARTHSTQWKKITGLKKSDEREFVKLESSFSENNTS